LGFAASQAGALAGWGIPSLRQEKWNKNFHTSHRPLPTFFQSYNINSVADKSSKSLLNGTR
jgi:hypothetical protein